MTRFDLTDFEWSVIQPLLPNKSPGVKWVDDRRVLNGIFWRLRTGAPWSDIPERYGPPMTCYNCFVRWRRAGVWDRILRAVSAAYEGDIQMIDSSSVRVHQHAANGKKGRPGCMGRSRGDLTTKIHALVDACGLPVDVVLSEGQAYDGHSTGLLFERLEQGSVLLADRAYDADAIREAVAGRGAWANIAPMSQRQYKPVFSRLLYRSRNLIERFFNKLKHFRAVATR